MSAKIIETIEKEQFKNVIETSQELQLEVTTLFKASTDIENDLTNIGGEIGTAW